MPSFLSPLQNLGQLSARVCGIQDGMRTSRQIMDHLCDDVLPALIESALFGREPGEEG
jgi:hypothetical protein